MFIHKQVKKRNSKGFTKKLMLKYIKQAIDYNSMDWFKDPHTIYWAKRFNISISQYQ